jgi:hypothetical protein
MSRACPNCGDPLSIHGVCGSCNYGRAKPKTELAPRPEQHRMTPQAKAAYEAGGPTSHSLTEQQWYNVCRFWPSIARRCSRPFAKIGPDNPLHATSEQGPIFKAMQARSIAGIDDDGEEERRRLDALLERKAIQSEGDSFTVVM